MQNFCYVGLSENNGEILKISDFVENFGKVTLELIMFLLRFQNARAKPIFANSVPFLNRGQL
jgi:hypothetical protein